MLRIYIIWILFLHCESHVLLLGKSIPIAVAWVFSQFMFELERISLLICHQFVEVGEKVEEDPTCCQFGFEVAHLEEDILLRMEEVNPST